MQNLPLKLTKSLDIRKQQNAIRILSYKKNLIDFSSNDYLGFSNLKQVYFTAEKILTDFNLMKNGATGSRLLSGNHQLFAPAEDFIANFHSAESALIFNSGYDANVGFFSSVPQRGDIIFYDELVHASIRDGISMSRAKAYKFKHNDIPDLCGHIERSRNINNEPEIYIVTESVFSMDGDIPDLKTLAEFAEKQHCFLVVDEAHATGVFGQDGAGMVQELGVQDKIFARIITFGKALGCHGAVILGSTTLKEYLVNFARSFIYTTALPPHNVATILASYQYLKNKPELAEVNPEHVEGSEIKKLKQNIEFFKAEIVANKLQSFFTESNSAIQSCILPGNEMVKNTASKLEAEGYNVKPILSPTVPKGKERLRFCLHSFNSREEISGVLKVLVKLTN
ncbi:MAG: pyridoxal phosphate-dependent aminotransferase family protein [Flavobacteriaceae bacterium]|nr:pyridoxal phosphate-dependent aminotransferase family protein [Flavobacteriaceae bacterium]